MKKLYSLFILLFVTAIGLPLRASECSVVLNVDNPDHLVATFDGTPLDLIVGSNEIKFEGDGYMKSYKLQVKTVSDDVVMNVVSETEGINPGRVERGVLWEKWFYEENDGNEFSVHTTDMSPLRTATCTINVLDAGGGIAASRGGHAFALAEGMNEVRFDPNTETNFVFTLSSWVSCHTFTVNGEDVEKQTYEYEVTLADGDDVVIAVYDPVNTVPVSITVNPEGLGAIRSVDINHVRYDNWQEGFTVKVGERVSVTCDTEEYNVKSLILNGVAQEYRNYVSIVAESDPIVIDIVAAPWGNLHFTVNTNIPEAVKMYYIESIINEDGDPDTKESERYALVKGENLLEMPERNARLVIVPRYGYETTYTYGDGTPVAIEDNTVQNVYDGMVLNLDSRELEYDSKFAVFAYGEYGKNEITTPGATPTVDFDFACYAHAWSEDWADIEQGGYTIIPTISSHDIQWLIAFEGCHKGALEIYLNDQSLTARKEIDTWGDWFETYFKPADGDVFRFYPTGTPARYDISFEIALDAAATEVVADHVKPLSDFESPYRAFEGQQFVVRPAEGAVVRVDGNVIEPDAAGNVTVEALNDCTVAVGAPSGIEDIVAGGSGASADVYNLQGMRLGDSLDNLPAGIYIRGGKKIIVK